MIRGESTIVIHGYMRNELNLKGNELIVYSIINGFSQDGKGVYFGSQSYIAEWCGISRRQVIDILKRLETKGLIKSTNTKNGQTKLYTVAECKTVQETDKIKTTSKSKGKQQNRKNKLSEQHEYDFNMLERELTN